MIQRSSKGVLPPTEHKWLGVSAYNLGLALFRGDLFGGAAQVLELACDELVGWCEEGRSEEEKVWRSEEVRVCVPVFLSPFNEVYHIFPFLLEIVCVCVCFVWSYRLAKEQAFQKFFVRTIDPAWS